jgi:hypothetical protein
MADKQKLKQKLIDKFKQDPIKATVSTIKYILKEGKTPYQAMVESEEKLKRGMESVDIKIKAKEFMNYEPVLGSRRSTKMRILTPRELELHKENIMRIRQSGGISYKKKSAKRKSAKRKSAKRKSAKRKSAKRKSAKRKSAKRKSAKRKSAAKKRSAKMSGGGGMKDYFLSLPEEEQKRIEKEWAATDKAIKKSSKNRKSPDAPARLFDTGLEKKGIDGNSWKVILTKSNQKRWQKISTEKTEKEKKARKFPLKDYTDEEKLCRKEKVSRVINEFKLGKLKLRNNKPVENIKQAYAIAMSEANRHC